jgi:hypothetical protein
MGGVNTLHKLLMSRWSDPRHRIRARPALRSSCLRLGWLTAAAGAKGICSSSWELQPNVLHIHWHDPQSSNWVTCIAG